MAWRVADDNEEEDTAAVAPSSSSWWWSRLGDDHHHHFVEMRSPLLHQERQQRPPLERFARRPPQRPTAPATRATHGDDGRAMFAVPTTWGATPHRACRCHLAPGGASARDEPLLPPGEQRGCHRVGPGGVLLRIERDTSRRSLARLANDVAAGTRGTRLPETFGGFPAVGGGVVMVKEPRRARVGTDDMRGVGNGGLLGTKCPNGFLPTLGQTSVGPQCVRDKRAEPVSCEKIGVANGLRLNVKLRSKAWGHSGCMFCCRKQTDEYNAKSSNNNSLIEVRAQPRLGHWDKSADQALEESLEVIRTSSALNKITNVEEQNKNTFERDSHLPECSISRRKIVVQMPLVPTWTSLTTHNPLDEPTDLD